MLAVHQSSIRAAPPSPPAPSCLKRIFTPLSHLFQGRGPIYWTLQKILSCFIPGLLISEIDRFSFHDLTKLRDVSGGAWERPQYERTARWSQVVDFYISMRSPQELLDRIHRENAAISLIGLHQISRLQIKEPVLTTLSPELRRQFRERTVSLSASEIVQKYRFIDLTPLATAQIVSFEEFTVLSRVREIYRQAEKSIRDLNDQYHKNVSPLARIRDRESQKARRAGFRFINPNSTVGEIQRKFEQQSASYLQTLESRKAEIQATTDHQIAALNAEYQSIRSS